MLILVIYFISIAAFADYLSSAIKGGMQSCAMFFQKVLTLKKIR